MADQKQGIVEEIIAINDRLWVRSRAQMANTWPDLELTVPQFRVLLRLSDGPARMSEIAAYLDVHLSSATTLIDRIVEKRLVVRIADPKDRRVVLCGLSRQGKLMVEKFAMANRLGIEEISDLLTVDELRTVRSALTILLDAVDHRLPTSDSDEQRKPAV